MEIWNRAKSKNSKYIVAYFRNVSLYQVEMVIEEKIYLKVDAQDWQGKKNTKLYWG